MRPRNVLPSSDVPWSDGDAYITDVSNRGVAALRNIADARQSPKLNPAHAITGDMPVAIDGTTMNAPITRPSSSSLCLPLRAAEHEQHVP